VAVVCGDADVLTPMALSEELAAAIPGATLTRLACVGHTPLIEAPGPLGEALAGLWRRCFSRSDGQAGG
jgi:pimeloyl-ACP methyl ester carboxylesterase